MEPNTPFVADGEEFQALSIWVRSRVRLCERYLRAGMSKTIEELPPNIAEHLRRAETEIPDLFLRGLLPFFQQVDEVVRRRGET